ncbi:uncharacterized protein MONOS_9270 [Monocercomonoides exilis]|uniref:uncharacterized protein n=1 Tax=Monocercomonoides exilis TaxID=2049356 RepID=UPI00355A6F8F|nr:hypothetical protein MONOS_9270 [Monocercomonoides exilis]|eukprot:MONOS_9270.1-p1 / transcript=MONOS_9270.1 / gene=MONOS_9270 / organism=Monocercomonoides_exilis_PA203 / gene_product=unspecified product / transcript_product=unspecified product / location=Mono_scaffold00376:18092-24618(-) / protein_length=2147 / sequence_SO=supercontig / SO=protein_coding / is_pseudo=false
MLTDMIFTLDIFGSGRKSMKTIFLIVILQVLPQGSQADYSVGIDHEQCGFAPFCRSIKYSLERTTSNSNKTLILRPSVFKEEQISISSNEFSVCGLSKNECVVQSASSSLSVINIASGTFCVQKVTMLQGNAESGTSMPFVVMDGDGSLTMEECEISSVDSELHLEMSFMQIFGGNVELSGVGIAGMNFLSDSLISFNVNRSGSVLYVVNTNFTSIQRLSGSGGITERCDASSGSVVVENCHFENVSAGKDGGGLAMGGEWKGELIVNGTTTFEGCCAGSLEEKGRGGGLFINVDSTESDFTIYESVIFSEENPNRAFHGSDVFVQCGSGLLLEEIIDQTSFGFFKDGNCMNNEEKLCGCEDGTSLPIIPLCVYLCDFESPISVDERSGADHSHCGYSVFCCSTIDFCVRERVNELVNAMEVISSASIKNPFVVPLFQTSQISISSSSASSSSSQYPFVNVFLTDNISTDCHNVIQCSGSFSLSFLSFVLPRVLPSSISSIIQSSIFLSLSNISIAFSADSLASSVAFSLIHVSGGELELTGLVVSEDVTFTALSPINVNGASRAAVEGCTLTEMANEGGSGGCVKVEMSGGGTISIKNTNISSKCKNEEGLRGGGMMVLIGSGGSLEMKNVNLSECEVPSEDVVDGGKGMGGGMFVALPEEIEKFVMEGMTFEGCNAWKGKNLFVSGWDLRKVVNKDHFKWEMSSEELDLLDELCGWERKTTGEEYVIPLVVYLWDNWSGKGFVSKEKGFDFSGCGYSEAPCSSVDHMIKMRFSPVALEKSIIKVEESTSLKHSVSLLPSKPSDENRPLISVEGGGEAVHLFVSGDGDSSDDGSLISNSVNASFSIIIIDLPSRCEFHKSFIRSVYFVSFSLCRFIPSDTLSPSSSSLCVLDIVEGDVSLEHCALVTLSLANPFLRLSANFHSAHMHNTSFINSSVSSDSFISVFSSELHSNQFVIGDSPDLPVDCPSMNMSSVTVENVSRTEEGSVFLGVDEFVGLKCGMENCTFWNCLSRQSNRGGGLMMRMKNEESSLGVKNCTFVLCACSESTGRGGGMMLDFCDPDAPFQTPSKPLLLHIAGVQFMMNSAFMGKDVFINCHSIDEQINETLFALDFSQPSLRMNTSICGSDSAHSDIDLIPLITFLYTPQVFVSMESEDSNQCGKQDNPCRSVSHGVRHVQAGLFNAICVDSSTVVAEPTVISDLTLKSISKQQSAIHFNSSIEEESEGSWIMLFENECLVEDCLFSFDEHFSAEHTAIMKQLNGSLAFSGCTLQSSSVESTLNSSVIVVEGGVFEMEKSSMCAMRTTQPLLLFKSGSAATLNQIEISTIKTTATAMIVELSASVNIMQLAASDILQRGENFISLTKGKNQHVNEKDAGERVVLQMGISSFSNITSSNSSSSNSHVVESGCEKTRSQLLNCSFERCFTPSEKGSLVEISFGASLSLQSCELIGCEDGHQSEKNGADEDVCKWTGSLIDVCEGLLEMKDTSITNSSKGGLSISGGSAVIESCLFENNSKRIERYKSARRNVFCTGSGTLNVVDLKGGDGWERNTSLWILNEGCKLLGMAAERSSEFFIPTLKSVETTQKEDTVELTFRGTLLLPCNLGFQIVSKINNVSSIETHAFAEDEFVSEEEVQGKIGSSLVSSAPTEAEVAVCILFGHVSNPSITETFVLKNRSETQTSGEEKIVEGGMKEKSFWPIIVIIMAFVLFIILIIAVISTIRWRKAKNENKDLREIVNDNIRKDPKAFEMVTMEMSPEDQWRRAEREAEKKNEERIKKRIYKTNMEHSESSEHLLSESGSTEYILGKDSDKIPQWMLEKVDEKEEEEEVRKGSPSPSISSTSTTDTSDTESTFVRGEDLCPTTSSMSNLVDAMACSSPHEKLIVDLRDSLFMLLHGRNKTKEMAIGTLQEREQTAAQILFWVANLALHSFDEMNNPLQSLANLSPHVVLFSEHMVICIALHSDCSSDDSDSSSISSTTTIATSSSDCSCANGNGRGSPPPSSAFEDDEDNRKDCMRWKAPELLSGTKRHATKKTVVFSIGMMAWECLTLQIPFGEYEAEAAGQKIANGERPTLCSCEGISLGQTACAAMSQQPHSRPTLQEFKKVFIALFPPASAMLTASDAIDLVDAAGIPPPSALPASAVSETLTSF